MPDDTRGTAGSALLGRRWGHRAGLVGVLLLVTGLVGVPGAPARADTRPASGLPTTVSADPLPTVQVDGVVYAQVTVGNRVFATGRFDYARPAGAAPGDASQVRRANLLSYELSTGRLDLTFAHTLNGTGRAIAASPRGDRVYVGGDFTKVDGRARVGIVGFSTATGKRLPAFTTKLSRVRSLAASSTSVFAGTATGRLVAFTRDRVLVSGWRASADREVSAMVVSPDQSKLIIGGRFGRVSGSTRYATAALKTRNGALLPWATSSRSYPIRDQVKAGAPASAASGVTSLSTDGTYAFLTSFAYVPRAYQDGTFEGRAAISLTDGRLKWLSDCHGDSYSAVPLGGVLYSVGHAHDCRPAGAFPASSPRTAQHSLAETTRAHGTNGPATSGYPSFEGLPRPSQLVWYPQQTPGTYTGQGQAGWSVTGNADYVAIGGEFRTTDGVAQQGLVRYALPHRAPNAVGPRPYRDAATTTSGSTVSFRTTWDPDNARLTYAVFRDGGTSPVFTIDVESRFWSTPLVAFEDREVTSAGEHQYRVVASDPFGNTVRAPVSSTSG